MSETTSSRASGYWHPSRPRLTAPPQLSTPTPKASEPAEQPSRPRTEPVYLPPNAPKRNGPIEREYKDVSNRDRSCRRIGSDDSGEGAPAGPETAAIVGRQGDPGRNRNTGRHRHGAPSDPGRPQGGPAPGPGPMSNLVRRLVRNSRGELVEADLEEATGETATAGFHDNGTYDVTSASGQTRRLIRARRYTPELTPPPPSRNWVAEHDYATRTDIPAASRQWAIANHRAWEELHSSVTNQMRAWLAVEGLLGVEVAQAHTANQRGVKAKAEIRQAIIDAKTAANQAATDLTKAVADHLDGNGPLPDGTTVTAAMRKVEDIELVVAHVDEAAYQASQRSGRAFARADWAAALAKVERLKGPEAAQAAQWLRAKLDPGPGPGEDPLRWL